MPGSGCLPLSWVIFGSRGPWDEARDEWTCKSMVARTYLRLCASRQTPVPNVIATMAEVDRVDLGEVLETATTVAVVGCSAAPTKTSHQIARYLQERGYRIVPVNPNYDEVLGETCYPDLPSVSADIEIDVVDIFRRPKFTADMVRTAIERVEETGEAPVIWTQLGVSSPEAEELAAEAGLPYVRNRCMKIEYNRLVA